MRRPTLPLGWPLGVAGWCFLLAVSLSAQDGIPKVGPKEAAGTPSCPPSSGGGFSEAPLCPHRKKSATLVPSFTKTTMTPPHPTTTPHHVTNHTTPHPNTTAHPQKHTTTHHHHHPHTTTPTAHPHNHTTAPHPHTTTTATPHPHNHTTAPHPHTTTTATPRPHNHTTAPHPHTTTTATPRPHNHTTAPHPHTTTTATPHPHNRTTLHPHNYTTTQHANATTAPATSHPPTTTPLPTQLPFVSVMTYVVENGSVVCLRAQMALELQVRYTNRAKQQLWGMFAVQPNHTRVSGSCSDKTVILELQFPQGFLLFTFQKNETQNKFYLSRIKANLTYQFQQATESSFRVDNASLHELEARLGHSYQCLNRSLAVSDSFLLNVRNERIQAFELKNGDFGDADICPEQRRSSVVPIVVGVLLGLLILIVVIAFLVGRRRAHAGYQTL
ncbi:hypothetical protein JRQ81_004556 [Phrynocephalus forsythii]|uniref:Uncharacterized protein n=1 Tax=Phrynocephalus forsythii TaxID=171643 RepID=A0A9Q1AVB1_9SAUR|nr:hypothetical protein JRQ81_004556 [Phrynocephalus forsythii]